MTDTILVRGVHATGTHGVLPQEKTTPQPFVVDLDLQVDLSWAGASDDLDDTVSYAEVSADVVRIVEGPGVDLIEHLAERIADACLAREAVEAVRVVVHKPQAPVGVPFGDVAVAVERRRDVPVVISLGANLGAAAATLASAAAAIGALPGVQVRAVSDLVDTDPVGVTDQPAYLNAVLLARTRLAPRTLLRELHRIEDEHGRVRLARWGARTLDLDLVQYGDPDAGTDVRSRVPELLLPHPRAATRGFVLVPWAAVDPGARLRVGRGVVSVAELAADLAEEESAPGVRPGPPWPPAPWWVR